MADELKTKVEQEVKQLETRFYELQNKRRELLERRVELDRALTDIQNESLVIKGQYNALTGVLGLNGQLVELDKKKEKEVKKEPEKTIPSKKKE